MEEIFLGTNWKMHKTEAETESYLTQLNKLCSKLDFNRLTLFVIPPYTSLKKGKEILQNSPIKLGAQNMHWKDEGAYTGEVSPQMLAEIGIDIIELGHSERREYYNETDIKVNKKVKTAIEYDFKPLICIGEKETAKKYDVGAEVIKKQIKIALNSVDSEAVKKIWLAYEPVWAIGEGGKPSTPEYAAKMHQVIRSLLADLYTKKISKKIPILYGGSVNLSNAASFLKEDNIDGLFIGRAAWEPESFSQIINELLNKN